MCCESQLIALGSASRWPAMRSRRLTTLSSVQSGKLNTVSVSGVISGTPAGCGTLQSQEGHQSFLFLSRRTQLNNDEWLPESWPLPPSPDGRFQVQVRLRLLSTANSRRLTGKKTSSTSFDLLALPPSFSPAAFGGVYA